MFEISVKDAKYLFMTKKYTQIINLLKLFIDSLTRLIENWGSFRAGQLSIFLNVPTNQNVDAWYSDIIKIQKQVKKLHLIRTCFIQKLDKFKALLGGVSAIKQLLP